LFAPLDGVLSYSVIPLDWIDRQVARAATGASPIYGGAIAVTIPGLCMARENRRVQAENERYDSR
jgi:hypothetical protein